MNYATIIRSFGFKLEADSVPPSLSPFAPVFRLANSDGLWIVKSTQTPLSRAQAIAAWTSSLAALGVSVVTPAPGFDGNPRIFQHVDREQAWTVYPFIHGSPYQGDTSQIRTAGDLLGKIHAAGTDQDFGLNHRATIVPIEAHEVEVDTAQILRFTQQAFPQLVEAACVQLQMQTQRYFQQALPRLLTTRLPVTNCSWDYKASNLVYQAAGPVLIDPDNGGRIPRAYDLAIAALLFHNEGAGPGRVFTGDEWHVFLDAYSQHVQLTELEKSNWEDILLCAWMDEALWLLKNDETGWANSKQSGLLKSLLFADLTTFALPNS